MSACTTRIQHCTEVLAGTIREENKGIPIRKEEIKLFTGNLIIYVESLKELTPKLLEVISSCCKFADTKLIYKSQLHCMLPTARKQLKRYHCTNQNVKHLRLTPTKRHAEPL